MFHLVAKHFIAESSTASHEQGFKSNSALSRTSVAAAKQQAFGEVHTYVNVKLLLSPRQSRGFTFFK
jgi:hypothetical protein